jgi:hypothetical protein
VSEREPITTDANGVGIQVPLLQEKKRRARTEGREAGRKDPESKRCESSSRGKKEQMKPGRYGLQSERKNWAHHGEKI